MVEFARTNEEHMQLSGIRILTLAIIGTRTLFAQVPTSAFANFEGSQTNPIRLSPDGSRLFAVNTPDSRLSIFDLSNPSIPSLLMEVPVGIEPVSVNPRTKYEAWVINQVSDSISIVSTPRGIVTDTLHVVDEPADVVFAGSNAYVSTSRNNLIYVFSIATHAVVRVIPLFGGNPRAMVVSPDSSKVYVAFALSGNRTTIIPAAFAPPQTLPAGSTLPPPPRVGLIADARDPSWSSVVKYTMPDNDVAVIDTKTLTVTQYYAGLGTINLGLALRPGTGDLYVANTDARNLIHFAPNLRGHWIDSRITRVLLSTGQISFFDLNPNINYSLVPNPAAVSTALSQPAGMVFDPSGNFLYLAAFGTDRVARVDPDGKILSIIEIGPSTGSTADPTTKRGPRGLALDATAQRLYVMNRISNTISIVDTSQNLVASEIPTGSFDPTPSVIRQGRGFLYDAKLSGNGTGACASCHIDGEMDHLAWDLGNPSGIMVTVSQNGTPYQMHPMKGPMVTPTLRGLFALSPFQWRGDEPTLAAGNSVFSSVMGGKLLAPAQLTVFTNFLNTIQFQPNPYTKIDGTLPVAVNGGDPTVGQNTFLNYVVAANVTCNGCHTSNPGPGTNRLINFLNNAPQPIKVPHLRNLYQKVWFNNTAGAATIDGFGYGNDGEISTIEFLLTQPGRFPNLANQPTLISNLAAYMLCFPTGTPSAVGFTLTLKAAIIQNASIGNLWNILQNRSNGGSIDLIAKGTLNGQIHGLLYRPVTDDYETDKTGLGPYTQAQLRSLITGGDILTIMGVPTGSGVRMGIDRDLNGVLDGDQ